MLEVETITRKWGNSIGLALPKDIIKKANIKPDKEIKIFIQDKNVNLTKIFGTLKIDIPTQKLLDEIRRGEE